MYDFYSRLARIINSGQSNSIIISGNIHDLFWDETNYVPLVPYLLTTAAPANRIQLVYELNGPIRLTPDHQARLKDAWVKWRAGRIKQPEKGLKETLTDILNGKANANPADVFDANLTDNAMGNSKFALEFLRQLCFCSREALKDTDLLIIIEAADMLVPAGTGDVASLNDEQLKRVAIIQDWFCDPRFMNARDTVCLLAESRTLIHPRISRLPQVCGVEVPSPSLEMRKHFIGEYCKGKGQNGDKCPTCHRALVAGHDEECPGGLKWNEAEQDRAAKMTAALSLHALRQLLAESAYMKKELTAEAISEAVEVYIQSQVGDDVVEFSRPDHKLDCVIGATTLVKFITEEMIPRLKEGSLSGCAVAGPIGGGKTYIFEAVAAELDIPTLTLKNLRSQWFGQTDVIFERLKRAIEALDKVCIFLDEADTQFGGVGAETHETERRLTGKVQAMMSDPRLKGKVIWLLMTARINLLSPDIRRPGRAGDLIIPVLDPEGQDRLDFIKWALKPVFDKQKDAPLPQEKIKNAVLELDKLLDRNYSAAAFAALRLHLDSHKKSYTAAFLPLQLSDIWFDSVKDLVADLIPPAIGKTRCYQTLQAMVNCTRRCLLPPDRHRGFSNDESREKWEQEIRVLEAEGIK